MPRTSDGHVSTFSRRDVLARGGVAAAVLGAGGVAVGSEPVAGQRITRRAVIPRAEDFTSDGDYTGFFLHIGETSTGDIDTSVIRDCEFTSWSPESTAAYNGTLIDRLEEDHRQVPTETYVNDQSNFEPGTLWVINRQSECPEGYVGLQIEQLGARIKQTTETPEETETTGTTGASGGGGPGLGPLAALAGGALGVAELVRRRPR